MGVRFRPLLWALACCVALTSIPLLLWVTRDTDGSEYRYWYGFLDRRWLVALYFIWVLGLPLLTLVMSRIQSTRQHSSAGRDSAQFDAKRAVDAAGREDQLSIGEPRWVKPIAAFGVLAVVWLLWGPPWSGPSLHIPVEFHESVHFKGLQAILSGSQPYVGAANEQYGPLSQLFTASWMTGLGTESIVGVRTAYLAMNFLAIAFLVIICFVFLRTATAAIVSLVVLALSPMIAFYGFTDQGMSGFWGWASLWRYSGLLLLGLGLPWLALRGDRGGQRPLAVTVGIVWAVTTLLAQENLVGGIIVAGAIAVALIASGHGAVRDTTWLILCLAGGAAATWVVYLTPYVISGRAAEFISNYLLVPLAVSRGYSGSTWLSSPWYALFVLGPAVMLMAGLLVVLARESSSRIGTSAQRDGQALAPPWITVVGIFVAAVTAQASVLNRADASHLLNCYVLFPIFLTLFALWAMWGKTSMSSRFRMPIAVAIIVIAGFAVNRGDPGYAAPQRVAERLMTAVEFRLFGPSESLIPGHQRVDAPLSPEDPAFLALSELSLAEASELTSAIRHWAGTQPVYLDPTLSGMFGPYLGYWYFSADARPVEVPYEEDSLVLTEHQHQRNLAALRDSGNSICTLVTGNPESEESRAVLSRIGTMVKTEIVIAERVVHIYSCREPSGGISREALQS